MKNTPTDNTQGSSAPPNQTSAPADSHPDAPALQPGKDAVLSVPDQPLLPQPAARSPDSGRPPGGALGQPIDHQPPTSPSCVSGCENLQPPTCNLQPPSLPFPQAKGESDRAFEAFRAYLELGPKRRFSAAARKVGVCYRTVSRWARDFDWRGRIKACSAHLAGQYVQTERDLQREQLLDSAERAQSFRERQYALAEALLDAAERRLEAMDADDPDQMTFAEACKALELASRLAAASGNTADTAAAPGRSLEDQITTLLDQACSEAGPQNDPAAQPASTSSQPKA